MNNDQVQLVDELERINLQHFERVRPLVELMRHDIIWRYRLEGAAVGAVLTAAACGIGALVAWWLS